MKFKHAIDALNYSIKDMTGRIIALVNFNNESDPIKNDRINMMEVQLKEMQSELVELKKLK